MKHEKPADDRSKGSGGMGSKEQSASRHQSYRGNRKALQLCRQVQRALTYALGDCDDDVLAGLYVEAVDPAPNDKHLMVTVAPLDADVSPDEALVRIQHVVGKLRSEVASAIHRKRVPELTFRCVPPTLPPPKTWPKD